MKHFTYKKTIQKILALLLIIILTLGVAPTSVVFADDREDVINYINQNYTNAVGNEDFGRNAEQVYNAIVGTEGIDSVRVENGALVYELEPGYAAGTVKGNLEANLSGVLSSNNVTNIIDDTNGYASFNTNNSNTGNESSTGENQNNGPISEEEQRQQFNLWLGERYNMSSGTLDTLWQYYKDGTAGDTGTNKAVEVETDENGNITNITLNLSDEQENGTGISDTTSSQIDENQQTTSEEEAETAFGLLASPFAMLLTGLGDAANWLVQFALIGEDNAAVTVKSDKADDYITAHDAKDKADLYVIPITKSAIDGPLGRYDIGTVKLTPAEIFAGNVAALDANFFTDNDHSNQLGGNNKSIVSELKSVVSGWYVAIRNIAIVGLLSVLIYLGIRIIISSSAGDKAKYKQTFMDWVIALCLIFFLHYIMVFAMTISESVTDMIAGNQQGDGTINQVIVQINADNDANSKRFYSNFVNVARIKTQLGNFPAKMGNVLLYLAFTAYTVYFAVIYLKRILMLAFLTIIAPFVSLTYPLDKLKDGHAQAFNFWLKDYIFYAMLQPLHMLLYTVFVSSALTLASQNMLYAIVAMAFIVPAEQIVKKMFGIHGNTESSISGFAGGAVAGTLLNRLNKPPKHAGSGGGSGSGSSQSKPRIARNPSGVKEMDAITTGSVPTGNNGGADAGAQPDGAGGVPAPATANSAPATAAYTYINGRRYYTARPGGTQPGGAGGTGTQPGDPGAQPGGAGTLPGGTGTLPQPVGASAQPIRPISGSRARTRGTKNNQGKRTLWNNAKQAVSRRYKLAGGKKGLLKAAARGVGKAAGVYAKIGGAVAGAALGAAIGMVGDGPAGMFKGMGLGLTAGAGIANRAVGTVGNAIGNTVSGNNALGSFISEVRTGNPDESARKNGETEFINDRANRERILQDNPEMSSADIDDYARREYNMMYDSKTDNVDLADKALELEQSFIDNDNMTPEEAHIRAAGILNATKNYDASTFRSNKKLQEAKDAMVDRVMASSNMSEEEARARTDRHFADIASLYGIKINDAQPQPQQQPQPQPQQQQQQQQQQQPRPTAQARRRSNTSGARTQATQPTQPTQQQTTRTIDTSRASRGTTRQNSANPQPVQPTQPAQPTQPTQPTQPRQQPQPVQPAQPRQQPQPVQPAQPTQPVQGARPTVQVRRTGTTRNSATRTTSSGTRPISASSRTTSSGTRTRSSGTRTRSSGTRTTGSGTRTTGSGTRRGRPRKNP